MMNKEWNLGNKYHITFSPSANHANILEEVPWICVGEGEKAKFRGK